MGVLYKKDRKLQSGGSFSVSNVGATSSYNPDDMPPRPDRFTTEDPVPEKPIDAYASGIYEGDDTADENGSGSRSDIIGDGNAIVNDDRVKNSVLMDTWTKMHGGDSSGFDKFVRLLGTISFAETRRQNIKTKAEGQSANGYFQFTNEALETDKQRAKNAVKDFGLDPKIFQNILNAKKAQDLSVKDQALLALLHMNYSKKIPLSSYMDGTSNDEDVYNGWVGDSAIKSKKVYTNNEHLINFRNKKLDMAKEGVNTDEHFISFLFGSKQAIQAAKGLKTKIQGLSWEAVIEAQHI